MGFADEEPTENSLQGMKIEHKTRRWSGVVSLVGRHNPISNRTKW